MLNQKYNIIVLTLVFLLVASSLSFAGVVEKIREEVPASWFENYKTASEWGITEFNQSPYLDDSVSSGKLPPVEERLPEAPPVIEPIAVGEYGGVHKIFNDQLDFPSFDVGALTYINLVRPTPTGKIKPYLARDYEYSEDATEFTLYLRKGIKWSDGTPFTADDFIYWWQAEANNEDLNPIAPKNWSPVGWEKLEKLDEYTIRIHFVEPNPLFIKDLTFQLGQVVGGDNAIGVPAHYLKQYHPDFTDDKEKLKQLIKEEGFDEWYQLYGYIKQGTHTKYRIPTLKPYVVKERGTTSILFTRNPYYPFVDSAGNQLPYIDEIRLQQIQDWTMYNGKAISGQATMGAYNIPTGKIQMYKKREDKENYTLKLAQAAHSSIVMLMPNMNHEDKAKREVMQKVEFRKALSLAIDRNEINQTFFYGQAKPFANTLNPLNQYYDESYQKYIDHQPEKAKELLDEIGLVDQDGDGWRDLPGGEDFNLTIEFIDHKDGVIKTTEMIIAQLKEVGLNFDMKVEQGALWDQRVKAGKVDITHWNFSDVGALAFPFRNYASCPFVPSMVFSPYGAHWVKWSRWTQTDGEQGEEPPAEIKKLINWYDEVRTTTDEEVREEYAQKILAENAEKIWTIGTVGQWPKPMIINDNLKNVPFWIADSSVNTIYPYHTETYYFEGGQAKQ